MVLQFCKGILLSQQRDVAFAKHVDWQSMYEEPGRTFELSDWQKEG